MARIIRIYGEGEGAAMFGLSQCPERSGSEVEGVVEGRSESW